MALDDPVSGWPRDMRRQPTLPSASSLWRLANMSWILNIKFIHYIDNQTDESDGNPNYVIMGQVQQTASNPGHAFKQPIRGRLREAV